MTVAPKPTLIELDSFGDAPVLTSIQGEKLPFLPKRVFFLKEFENSGKRANHAHKYGEEILIAQQGRFIIEIYDGKNWETYTLDRPNLAIHIPNLCWIKLSNFSDDCICLGLVSHDYEVDDYIKDFDDYEKIVM